MATAVHKKYALAEFTLEPGKRLLMHAGTPVHLAHRPFQVLLYLIENRERVVTRRELLERFWEGHDVYEVALSKCVGAIRKALNDQLERPRFIETRWAEGYRYVGPLEEQPPEDGSSLIEIEKTRGLKIVVEEESEGFPAESEKVVTAEFEKAASPAPSAAPLPLPRPPSRPARKLMPFAACALLVLAAGAFLLSRERADSGPRQFAPSDSVAVLPLKNLTGDPGNEYFSDGMTESLITALSKIDGLKVISRGSAFRYKGKEADPQEVGEQLKVASLLEGGVRRDGDSVRVAVRLVSTADGRVLWANESYDRKIQDIFGLQDEIARHVVAGLRVKLNEEGARRLTKRHTENADAYDAYLRGRFLLEKRTGPAAEKSVEYFEQSVKLDSNYAPAYAGLSYAYWSLGGLGVRPSMEVLPKANEAVAKALALDDSLAEAYSALGHIRSTEWDWPGAERAFRRATELNPNSGFAHSNYAFYFITMRRFDEAIAESKRAVELEPTSVLYNRNLAMMLYSARRYDEAIEQGRKTLELDPIMPTAYRWLAMSYEQKGLYEQALEAFLKTEQFSRYGPEAEAALRASYAASGWKGFWRKALDLGKEMPKQRTVAPGEIARTYARLGEKDQSFAWLERVFIEERAPAHLLIGDPVWDGLRPDPRYADLVRRMNLEP